MEPIRSCLNLMFTKFDNIEVDSEGFPFIFMISVYGDIF